MARRPEIVTAVLPDEGEMARNRHQARKPQIIRAYPKESATNHDYERRSCLVAESDFNDAVHNGQSGCIDGRVHSRQIIGRRNRVGDSHRRRLCFAVLTSNQKHNSMRLIDISELQSLYLRKQPNWAFGWADGPTNTIELGNLERQPQRKLAHDVLHNNDIPNNAGKLTHTNPQHGLSYFRQEELIGADNRYFSCPSPWSPLYNVGGLVRPTVIKGGTDVVVATTSVCTGTLVGSRHVLTAAHCFAKYGLQFPVYFQLGMCKNLTAYISKVTKLLLLVEVYNDSNEVAKTADFAIAVLDMPLGTTFGWFGGKTWTPELDMSNAALASVAWDMPGTKPSTWVWSPKWGYSKTENFNIGYQKSAKIWHKGEYYLSPTSYPNWSTHQLGHQFDTVPGSSGASIFLPPTGTMFNTPYKKDTAPSLSEHLWWGSGGKPHVFAVHSGTEWTLSTQNGEASAGKLLSVAVNWARSVWP